MDREKTRAQLVLRVNEVQAKCWPHKAAWRGDEVDFIGYVNEQGLLEGMVTLAKRGGEGNSMEEEMLVGSALAFVMGNSVQTGAGQWAKWCPVLGRWGVTTCRVVSITAAYSWKGPNRRQVVFGEQRRGVRG